MRASKKKLEDLLGSSRVRLANEVAQVQVITSGIAAIDYITGVGGFPRGSIVEMYGRESIGKSSLAYYAMAERIKRGEPCAYVNVEGNLDIAFAERISGIDSS
jgi:recombination protein RecA